MSLSVSRHPSSPFTASSSHRVTRSKTYIPASEVGTPICIPSRDFIDIGRIASIENNHTPVDYAKKGLKGAIKNVEVFMDAFRAVIEERIKNKCHVFLSQYLLFSIWLRRLRTLIYQGGKQILKATQQEQMTFSEPKSKLEIVVHYLWKYMTKPSVHTRKSNGCPEDATFEVALKCFSNKTGTKSTIKKIGPDVMQFLVGHRYSFFVILVGRWFCNRSNGLIPVI
ncbi:hypothetical protein Ahy_B06g080458 isoform E [Arachis hypogaea]|uniref:Uncharacterized protein n=1 Tax=Arachis hypogaea TaxID=3818 RepID=A0A444YI39_ARAHY|nr:hypothetical protein Ahy_B06g080458 isoform E [Arachis hypogaea]